MARIRSIKPEFWEDEEIALLSRDARLLYIASWNMADDEGLLRWSAPYLKANAFMYDHDVSIADVERLMGELARFVFAYKGGKAQQTLGWITTFHRHQKPNRPQPSKLPAPAVHDSAVRDAYGQRDGWVCGTCGGEIHRAAVDEHGLSVERVKPRAKGGTEYPSNVRAVHRSCATSTNSFHDLTSGSNDSVNDALNDSVNGSRSDAATSSEPVTAVVVVGEEGSSRGEVKHSVTAPAAPAGSSPAAPATERARPLALAAVPDSDALAPQTTWALFWQRWPVKHHKQAAKSAWNARGRSGSSDAEILEGLDRWVAHWHADSTEDRHIPHPARWIRERYWLEPTPALARSRPQVGEDRKTAQARSILTNFVAGETAS